MALRPLEPFGQSGVGFFLGMGSGGCGESGLRLLNTNAGSWRDALLSDSQIMRGIPGLRNRSKAFFSCRSFQFLNFPAYGTHCRILLNPDEVSRSIENDIRMARPGT